MDNKSNITEEKEIFYLAYNMLDKAVSELQTYGQSVDDKIYNRSLKTIERFLNKKYKSETK